jgi:hypothetical protein
VAPIFPVTSRSRPQGKTILYLQRLSSSTRNYSSGSPTTVNCAYGVSGSFLSKNDYASSYSYHANRHAFGL